MEDVLNKVVVIVRDSLRLSHLFEGLAVKKQQVNEIFHRKVMHPSLWLCGSKVTFFVNTSDSLFVNLSGSSIG